MKTILYLSILFSVIFSFSGCGGDPSAAQVTGVMITGDIQ